MDKNCNIPIYSNGIENDGLYGFTDKAKVSEPSITISARGTIGFCCVREHPFVPIVRLITITPSTQISIFYLSYVFNKLMSNGKGSSIPQLTVPDIRPKLIPLPPVNEMSKIVDCATKSFHIVEQINYEAVELECVLNTLKSKILDLAIRGKLVPQDPKDEPADVLLERIRKEKEKLIKQGKIKRDKKESIIFKGDDNSYYEKIDNSCICIDDELPFEKPDNWAYIRLKDIVSYEQPISYIVTSTNYSKNYKIPVLTAGKSFIIGYTNENFGIRNKLPAIIFDDFTTDLRLIDFPFKVKSSAMKILSVDESLMSYEYAYFAMKNVNCDHYNHKRYWISDFSKKIIALPPKVEQERILKGINDIFRFLESIEKSLS